MIRVLDNTGKVVVKYVYNAWGKIEKILDATGTDISSDSTHIGNINPIRYRSYYYDRETELYYLQSRYYDPETGRFVNADDIKLLVQNHKLDGYNFFIYCFNNPIVYSDKNGKWVQMIFGAVLGAFLNGVSYLFCVLIQSTLSNISKLKKGFDTFFKALGKSFRKKYKWYKLVLQITIGAISGAFSMSILSDFTISLANACQNIVNGIADGTAIYLIVLDVAINFFLDNLVRGKLSGGNEFNKLGKNLVKKLKSRDWVIIKKAFKYYFSQTKTNYKKYFKKTILDQLRQLILSLVK